MEWVRLMSTPVRWLNNWGLPMSDRVRNGVLLLVLTVWVVVIGAYLIRDQLPDAALVGIPAAVILALGRRQTTAAVADTEPEPATPAEGDAAP